MPGYDRSYRVFKKRNGRNVKENQKIKMEISNKILSDITVYMKYAKFVPELNRRETWVELVTGNKNMHIKKYPELSGSN